MKKCLALFFCVLLLFGCLTGCTKKTYTGGKMHYDLTAEPKNLDPQTASDVPSMTVIHQMFETLFALDENGEIVPAAADSYTVSEDGLTYRILVRTGMKWQNGAALDAEDFAYGLQRVLMKETMSPHASKFYGIQHAKEYHEGTVGFDQVGISHNGLWLTVTLQQADESFLKLLTLTASSPCDEAFFTSTKGKYGLEAGATNANGAFYLHSWSHDQYLKLSKNANYRAADTVSITGVTMWTNNIEGREETFWNGKTQACYVSGESYAEKADEGYAAKPISDMIYGVVYNKKTAALQNTNIRKAIAALFDRESYRDALPGYLTVRDRAYPSGCAVDAVPYDLAAGEISAAASVEQAKKWYQAGLAELDQASVSGLKIVVLEDETVKNGDFFLKLSQAFQKHLDLYIGIERLEKEAYEAAIDAGEFDLAIVALTAEDLSPYTLLSDFASGHFACTDGRFAQIYHDAASAKSAQKLTLFEQAEEILLLDGWFIPMYEKAQYFVCGSDTEGITYSPYTGLVSFAKARYLED